MKICPQCQELKPESEFGPKKERRDGLNSKCRKCSNKTHRKYMREYKKKNPDTIPKMMRELHLKKTYGITPKEWNRMFKSQGGKCVICGVHQSELKNYFCVDHNHNTGKVRGLLCIRCNYFLGKLENNVELVERMFEYLKETK